MAMFILRADERVCENVVIIITDTRVMWTALKAARTSDPAPQRNATLLHGTASRCCDANACKKWPWRWRRVADCCCRLLLLSSRRRQRNGLPLKALLTFWTVCANWVNFTKWWLPGDYALGDK